MTESEMCLSMPTTPGKLLNLLCLVPPSVNGHDNIRFL